MELKEATAILQEKSQFFALKKANAKDLLAADAWAQNDNKYRVGIFLKGRPQGAVFYYTKSMHEAKFLLVNIQLYGNQFKAVTMANKIEMSYLIERSTRL